MNVNLIIVSYMGCFAYEMKAHPKFVFASTLIFAPVDVTIAYHHSVRVASCLKNQNCRLTALVVS